MQIIFNFIIYCVLAFAVLLVSILIHELGHLVFGLLSGYKFSLFRFLFFTISKENGKLKFKFSANSAILGQCLMAPTNDESKFKFVMYNLGGGLLNLISGMLALIIYFTSDISFRSISVSLVIFAVSSFYFSAVNLIPLYSNGIPNDGMNVKTGSKSSAAKHGFYIMLKVNAEITAGKRYRDISKKTLEVNGDIDYGNYFEIYPLLIASDRLIDLGEYDSAFEILNTIKTNDLPQYYKFAVDVDKLYYYCAIDTNKEKANKLFSDKYMQKMLYSSLPTCPRVLAAYEYFIKNNPEKARAYIKRAKLTSDSLPGAGQVLMEKNRISELENLIAEHSIAQ